MPDIFIPKTQETTPEKAPAATTSHLLSSTSKPSMFSAFSIHPSNVSFETQEPGEEILLFLRKHFVTNFFWILGTLLMLLIPPMLVLLSSAGLLPLPFTFPNFFLFFFTLLYYLFVFTYAYISFITWFYNISIVSNKRIVDIDYSDLVYRNVAVTKLEMVEDINYTQTGFIRSLFNYGDVMVQTAGEHENFDFLAVPQPARVVNIIQDLMGKRSHHV